MRFGTFKRMAFFVKALSRKVVGENEDGSLITEPRKLGFGGWLCWGVRVAGVFMFGAAVATLGLPWLAGWTILETLVAFSMSLFLSRQLLDFHIQYLEVEATILHLWAAFKGRSLREQAQVMA